MDVTKLRVPSRAASRGPRARDEIEATVVDLGDSAVVTFAISDDADVDEVRCNGSIVEVLANDEIIASAPLPRPCGTRVTWSRQDDMVNAIIPRH